jgi:hypothetical protein
MSEHFDSPPDRRTFLKAAAGAFAGLSAGTAAADEEQLPPVRALTRGPKFHWFGYYDKLEFDPSGRHVLGMEVDFEHRSPKADDVIKVGMVYRADDLFAGRAVRRLGGRSPEMPYRTTTGPLAAKIASAVGRVD